MSPILLTTILLSATPSANDGALLVFRGGSKPVAVATGSDITHVAVVLRHGSDDWVYEATPAKVRRLTLTAYRSELATASHSKGKPAAISLMCPKQPYTSAQLKRMRDYAAAQIGRRYSIKGYVRGKEFDGMHCAHFAAATLESSGRFNVDEEYAMTPGQLVAGVANQHQPLVPLTIKPIASDQSWCEESWTTWFNYAAWCRWASYETWSFCW